MSVGSRIGDDDEAGFFEGPGDIVGEVTGCETTCNGNSSGVRGELEDGALTVGTRRDDTNVGGVVDGGDNAGSKDNFLPVARKLC